MSCIDCDEEVIVKRYDPYNEDVVLPPGQDFVIKIQGVKDGVPFNYDSGTFTLTVTDEEGAQQFTLADGEFTRSQSAEALDNSSVGYNDVVKAVAQRADELTGFTKETPYPFQVTYDDGDSIDTLWSANLILL